MLLVTSKSDKSNLPQVIGKIRIKFPQLDRKFTVRFPLELSYGPVVTQVGKPVVTDRVP